MPAYLRHRSETRPRDRAVALAAVLAVQLILGAILLSGLRVDLASRAETVERLITVALREPPPPPTPPQEVRKTTNPQAPAPKMSAPAPPPVKPAPASAPAPIIATVTLPSAAPAAPAGGRSGAGSGAGAGIGAGYGGGGGGTDLVQIAGEIRPSDYPRNLRDAGIGGRVGLEFTVGTNGRVTRCTVTSSSGVPQLDALTCRLIQERFLYRPSTDRYGRPIADVVDGDHEWIPRAR